MKWILLVPLLCALRLPFDCAVLCGLVPDRGSAVVRRSSRSLRGFSASLPVAWSHPTIVRYKASYPLFAANYPCSFWSTVVKIGPPSYRFISVAYHSFSPFVINFHKRYVIPIKSLDTNWKSVNLIVTKDCIGTDGWGLNLAFFMDITICVGMILLELLLRYHIGSLTLIPFGRALPLCHSMGHSP